jgi:hypothetical protein
MSRRILRRYYAQKQKKHALFFSLCLHGIAALVFAIFFLKGLSMEIEDNFAVELIYKTETHRQPVIKKKRIEIPPTPTVKTPTTFTAADLSSQRKAVAPVGLVANRSAPALLNTPSEDIPDYKQLAPSPATILDVKSPLTPYPSGTTTGNGTGPGKKDGTGTGAVGVPKGKGSGSGGLGGAAKAGNTGQDAATSVLETLITSYADEIGNKLGSVIDESDGVVRGHIRLIRLKHAMSDWWQDPTAIPALLKWIREHNPSLTADMSYAGGALPLTDARIMDAPLLIMTGHDQAMSVSYSKLKDRNTQATSFSEAERAALRKYILEHNGMLFFDYCGSGGNEKSFANIVENELRQVFPEYPLTTLDNLRLDIFRCYFELTKTPVGGSVFWGTGYKGGNHKWRHLKGIFVPGKHGKDRLGVIFCHLDYLCSMETVDIDSRAPLASRRSSDVYRFMVNMFIYQMRQRTGMRQRTEK